MIIGLSRVVAGEYNRIMPSVTEVLDYLTPPELVNWMERTSKAKRKAIQDEALAIGTEVDRLVQMDIKGEDVGPLTEGSAVWNCFQGWLQFRKDHPDIVSGIVIENMQRELIKGEITGHPDLPVIQKDRVGIIDLKCSARIYPKYWTQAAKYLDMYELARFKRFIGVLRLEKKEPRYEYIEITSDEYICEEIANFDAYYRCYRHAYDNREVLRQIYEELKL